MDYSCYITVTNNLNGTLNLTSSGHSHGDWDGSPPGTIAARTSCSMRLKDRFGFYGAEGDFTYGSAASPFTDQVSFQTSFGCPFSDDNYVRNSVNNANLIQVSYRAKSDGNWESDQCPKRGHPLTIEYTIGYVTIATRTNVSQIMLRGDFPIQNAAGVSISYSDPIWSTSRSYNEGPYSTNPGLLRIGHGSAMTVVLAVDSALQGVTFTLAGYLGSKQFASSGPVTGTPGSQSVPVTLTGLPASGASQLLGDVQWKLTVADSGQVITLLATTRLELYWIYGTPGSMFTRGVWASVLRNLLPAIAPGSTQAQAVASVVNSCFSASYGGTPKQYDTAQGAPHFGTSWYGGYIDLKLYYSSLETYCNCYDQAGIVQVGLGALGLFSSWAYLQPCGFINQTNLIGWGSCNNPFFNGVRSNMVLAINDPGRTMFANHAFVVYVGNAADACQGPYTGAGTVAQYITAIIDTVTTLYSHYTAPSNRPGTAGDVWSQKGIVSVESLPMSAPNPGSPQEATARKLIDVEAASARWGGRSVSVDWGRLPAELFAGLEVRAGYRRTTLALDGAQLTWIGDFGESRARLDAFVSSKGPRGALDRMLEFLAAVSRPLEGWVAAAPAALGPAALALPGPRPVLLWVSCNVFVRLEGAAGEGEDMPADLVGLAERLEGLLRAGEVASETSPSPQVGTPRASASEASPGGRVSIEVGGEGLLVEPHVEGGALAFESSAGGTWHFRAVAAGEARVVFTIADPRTLAVVNRAIDVRVNP